jgi:hypothetical protein
MPVTMIRTLKEEEKEKAWKAYIGKVEVLWFAAWHRQIYIAGQERPVFLVH